MKKIALLLLVPVVLCSQDVISLGTSTQDSTWNEIEADTVETNYIREKTGSAGIKFGSDVEFEQNVTVTGNVTTKLRIDGNGSTDSVLVVTNDKNAVLDSTIHTGPTGTLYAPAMTITDNALAATSVNALTLQNTTDATVGVPVQVSPGIGLHDEVWDTDGSNDYYDWSVYSKGTSGANTSSTMYFDVSKNGAASANAMSLTSVGILTAASNIVAGGLTVLTSSALYNVQTSNGLLVFSNGAWYLDNTGLAITKASPDDQDTYGLKINYDADSDASATTASQFAITPTGNATPANSYIHLTNSGGSIGVTGNGTAPGFWVKGAKTSANLFQVTNRDDGTYTAGDSVFVVGSSGIVQYATVAGITATNPGIQGNNVLTARINEISTVGTADDAVTLPAAAAGLEIFIINNGANQLEIWPNTDDDAGAGVNSAITLAAGSNLHLVAYDATNWETF